MKKKWLLNGLLVLCVLVFAGCAFYLGRYFLNAKNAEDAITELQELKKESGQAEEGEELKTEDGEKILKQYKKLYRQNPDLIGWIQVKGTKIDYPVMQTKKDSEYYLHRNYKKADDVNGLPFLDASCDAKDEESNLMVYGHHMRSGLMFAHLLDFNSKEFYEKHKTVLFDTLYQEREYEVVAAFYSQIYKDNQDVFRYYNYIGHLTKKQFKEYVKNIRELSVYDTGIVPEYGEQLLTMVTCAYHVEDGRFVVVARRKQ